MEPTAPDDALAIGIVGGEGQMGRWFARFFMGLEHRVMISDRHTTLTNRDVAARCALTLACVPMPAMPAVLRELTAVAPPRALIVSTASLMEPSAAPLREARGEALCLHPLFGPGVASPRGQILASAVVRPGPLGRWLCATLAAAGATVREMAPAEHDRAMASVQVMQHASFVAFAAALASAGPDVGAALDVATPTFRLFLALAARILQQDPHLYTDIVTLNPRGPAALDALHAALEEVRAAVAAGDGQGFEALFLRARAYVAPAPGLADDAERALRALS